MTSLELTIWSLAVATILLVVVPYAVAFHRRVRRDEERRREAVELGIDRPTAQYPYIDQFRCIGCGACVEACPEGDVLGVVGGTAVVINGLRCIGHAACEIACPVGAIEVGLGDVKTRSDIPQLTDTLETTVPGVFVVGELGGLALIHHAVEQGRRSIDGVEGFLSGNGNGRGRAASGKPVHDIVIVGAGPAGLSAGLEAHRRGFSTLLLEQEADLGGSVLHYPRRKLVMTQPVELPAAGALESEEYRKEELLEILRSWVQGREIPIAFSQRVVDMRTENDLRVVQTETSTFTARSVVLATGRRGTPRKLGVPGEDLSKVMYRLLDADSYRDQRILVVGGGDSAVEAAIGLGRGGHNHVCLSYRKPKLVRIKQKNQKRIEELFAEEHVHPLFGTEVSRINESDVILKRGDDSVAVENDYVFVFIGGEPPFPLLRKMGIEFGGGAPD